MQFRLLTAGHLIVPRWVTLQLNKYRWDSASGQAETVARTANFFVSIPVLNVVLVRKFELVTSKPGSTLPPKKLVVEVRSLKCGSQQHRNVMKGRGCASDAHVLAGYSEVILSVLSLDRRSVERIMPD